MTLTGQGDLVLHEGALHIQPPPFIFPGNGVGLGSTRPTPTNSPWRNAHPPKALTVSGGSLDVRGAGAEIRSTRAKSPALSVSVGLMDDVFEGKGDDGLFLRNDTNGRTESNEGENFLYSGVALAVNVRETALKGERVGGKYGDGKAAAAEISSNAYYWIRQEAHPFDSRLRNHVEPSGATFVLCNLFFAVTHLIPT